MSKSNIRKITVDPTKCNIDSRRPSVFERLGTKPAVATAAQNATDFCRNWAVTGNCSYGKSCKYANTHTLISPSKRVKKDNAPANPPLLIEDPFKRLTSKIVKTTSHSPDLNLEEWNQTDLEYEDEKVLERRRQLLQRELELQMKKDKEVHGKEKVKYKKKAMSSSSSSHSSTSSSSSSSSSSDDSSSSSTSDSRKKVKKFKKTKHSASPEFDDDKERKKKLKLKRLGANIEKLPPKKKRKLDESPKKDSPPKSIKKPNTLLVAHKHISTPRAKSPAVPASVSSHSGAQVPAKAKERTRSASPRTKLRESEKDRHHKKLRESDEMAKEMHKKAAVERIDRSDRLDRTGKDVDKSKLRPPDDKGKSVDRSKARSKDRERRSRTPPLDRSKGPYSAKDSNSLSAKSSSKRSRTPDKSSSSSRSRNESSRPQDKQPSRSREPNKRAERSKDRDDGRGKLDRPKSLSQDEQRKARELEDKRAKDRRDKEHNGRDSRSHSRIGAARDKERDRRPERERERDRDRGDRDRDRDRDRDGGKREREREREPLDKATRYKDRPKELGLEKGSRDRDRERRPEPKSSGSSQRGFEGRERDKSSSGRDHQLYRHRYASGRFADERGKEPIKLDRRESPRREFERGYGRLAPPPPPPPLPPPPPPPPPAEHWDEQEEPQAHLDYREHHGHEDERRKSSLESRRYNSPFAERGRATRAGDDRSSSRYGLATDRPFQELHHPLYAGDKLRPARDEANSDNWEVHHEGLERERPYAAANEWEDREWRGRAMWDRESLPRSEAHDEEWSSRYDNPDWKVGEPRKWDNQSLHLRSSYRNDRIKELELTDSAHCKRRPFVTPDRREELPSHAAKQALHNSMKDEPINKKLMELAEGRPRRSREKSADSFHKKMLPKEKPEVKEPPPPEPKRSCLDEPLPTLHTESDLSDISDDPDDILNMEEEITTDIKCPLKKSMDNDRDSASVKSQELSHPSPKLPLDDGVFSKDKDTAETYSNKNNIEEESMETMDFEEISDGELEEDIKTSCKGLGDALGVDWESLVKESQPRRLANTSHDNAQDRWQCKAVFQRIGISVKAAGHDLVEKLLNKYNDDESNKLLLNNVAFVHTALARKQLLPNSSYKLISNDDLLYRTRNEVDMDDVENLVPCTSLYEEAKMLLQQTA